MCYIITINCILNKLRNLLIEDYIEIQQSEINITIRIIKIEKYNLCLT